MKKTKQPLKTQKNKQLRNTKYQNVNLRGAQLVFTFSLPGGVARLLSPINYATWCVRVRSFSTMKEVKSAVLNRNWIADETLDDGLRLAATNTGIAKGTIVS